MPTYQSSSYRPSECCHADCVCGSFSEPSEPCWGTVVVVGEDYDDDEDSYWVHACEGHVNCHDGDSKYTPEVHAKTQIRVDP